MENPPHVLVGIGASAGGLDALTRFVSRAPPSTGISYVVVQHLDPGYVSLLSELLAKATQLQVKTIEDGDKPQADCVHVAPSGYLVTITESGFHLQEFSLAPSLRLRPIDHFLFSLANELKENAVAIILSGMGSDGAAGIAAVNAVGGNTFAQSPETSEFSEMPRAAIRAGAEYTLSIEKIVDLLPNLSQEAGELNREEVLDTLDENRFPLLNRPTLARILHLLLAEEGVNFSLYKKSTMVRRMLSRMRKLNCNSYEAYLAMLNSNKEEVRSLREELLIHVTYFFRFPESIKALCQSFFPAVLVEGSADAPCRIWVPGCSSGEEVYSLAIEATEYLESKNLTRKIEIFGTDISAQSISLARAGLYAPSALEKVTDARLLRFFQREGEDYRVSKKIRSLCVFANQDVTQDPPFSRIDLISCQNLLIYLTPAVQQRVLKTFHYALCPSGFLALGHSESIDSEANLFSTVDSSARLFRKISNVNSLRNPPPTVVSAHELRKVELPDLFQHLRNNQELNSAELRRQVEKILLQSIQPVAIVINAGLQVLQVVGNTAPYLKIPEGELSFHLAKMTEASLVVSIRMAVAEASEKSTVVTLRSSHFEQSRPEKLTKLTVVPFVESSSAQEMFVVLLEPITESHFETSIPGKIDGAPAAHSTESETEVLKKELQALQNFVKFSVEREQAANLVLRAISDELLSSNEEIQSRHEELATAKEELQTANESLLTVNEGLSAKNELLHSSKEELTSLLGSVDYPIVLVSSDAAVKNFNSSAEKFFRLAQTEGSTDLQRALGNQKFQGIPLLIQTALSKFETITQEMQCKEGKWFAVRIVPILGTKNSASGAVISVIDIDTLKRKNQTLQSEFTFAEAILQLIPTPLVVLDEKLRILQANKTFLEFIKCNLEDVKGKTLWNISDIRWHADEIKSLLGLTISVLLDTAGEILSKEIMLADGKIVILSTSKLPTNEHFPNSLLLTVDDKTNQRIAEREMQISLENAKVASQAKDNFLSNMSHELRTPLGAVLGYAELLSDPSRAILDSRKSVHRIRQNVNHLISIIDDVLNISKIESGTMEISLCVFRLLVELESVFDPLKLQAAAKGLAFEVSYVKPLPEYVLGCAKYLRQVLFNVCGNAIKFTENGGVTILVDWENTQKQRELILRIAVTDTGCGIEESYRSKLFEPFSQGDSSIARKYGGTGLGLVISRQLVRLMGGELRILDTPNVVGTSFVVSLRLKHTVTSS